MLMLFLNETEISFKLIFMCVFRIDKKCDRNHANLLQGLNEIIQV